MANKQFIVKHGMDVKRNDGASSLDIDSTTGAMTVGHALATNSTITAGDKLTVSSGGADIAGALDAQGGLLVSGGDLTVTNNLIVNGTMTTVNSTTVTVDDPVFTLGGDTDPTGADTFDRGIEFRYYDGSAKRGFMGWDNSEGKFRFLTDATNTSEAFSGTDATLVAALEGNASTSTALAAAGTLALTAGDIVAVSDSSADGNYSLSVTIDSNKITFAKMQQLADMKVMGNVSGGTANAAEVSILDEDNMISDSNTALATQQSIKAYVDAQISSANALSELDEVTITSADAGDMLMYHDGQWRDVAMSGDVTITSAGVTTIGAGTVHNPMLEHDSVTVVAGDALTGGGEVDLGASITLNVATDNSTLEIDSDALRVKDGGVTNAKLEHSSLTVASANAALTATAGATDLGGTSTLTVVVDDSSIEIDGGLKVKAHGIKEPHIDWGTGANQVSTDNVPEGNGGSALYFTEARARAAVSAVDAGGDGSFAYNSGTGAFTYTGPSAAEARAHFSATDAGGDGSFSYDSGTGAFTYTGPSANETRAHFSASGADGLNYAAGDFTLDQDIRPGASPTFAGINITGNLNVAGTTTTVNSATMEVEDSLFLMAKNNAANVTDIGIAAPFTESGTAKFATFFRDATDGKWKLAETEQNNISTSNEVDTADPAHNFTKATLVADLEGDVTGNADSATILATTRTFAISGGGITAAAQDFNGSQNVSLSASIDDNAVTLAKMAQLADMKVIGNVSGGAADPAAVSILDEDDMASDSNTALATQQSIKAYVDNEITAAGSLAALSDTTVAAAADAHIMVYDNATSKWENQVMAGDVTMDKDGATSIGADKVTNAMILNETLSVAAGDGLATTSESIALGASATLSVNVDDSSIEIDSDSLRVKALGITNGMLAGTIADGKLEEDYIKTSEVDGSSIEFAGGSLNVKASGVTDAMLAGLISDGKLAQDYIQTSEVDDSSIEFNGGSLNVKALGVTNAMLANKTFSISGKSADLGGNADLDALTSASNALTMSGDYNGSAARTVTLTLADADALEVGASGLDLKDTIAGARTFSAEVTASAGVDVGDAAVFSGNYTMTAAAEEVADEFDAGIFRSAKYTVQVTNQAGSEYQCSELLIIHDDVTASVAEYGLMFTGAAALASFDVDVSGGNVRVKATAGNGDVIKMSRTCVKA